MEFGIVVSIDRRNIRLQVDMKVLPNQLERFEIKARNKSLTIQSNRLLLRKKGIKHRKPDYKLIGGTINSSGALENIIDALHHFLELKY